MPVNLSTPDPASLSPVPGVELGIACAGIKKPGRKDVLVMRLAAHSEVVGVFTQNRFCAAPVTVCKEHLHDEAGIRALVVNTGNANAGTGDDGLRRARQTCAALADALGFKPGQILPFSTGVILEPLPVDKVIAALPAAIADLKPANWGEAAQAIMTTDIVAKATSRKVALDGQDFVVTGIAKGSGMIHPNMATMLSYVATDAPVSCEALEAILRHAVNKSFNCITVDGDTSTNDSCILIATGATVAPVIMDDGDRRYGTLRDAVTEVMVQLAQAIVRDGEGATKFMSAKAAATRPSASRSPTPSPGRPWSRPPSSLPTPIWAASSRRWATPASPTWTWTGSSSGWGMSWSPKTAAARPAIRRPRARASWPRRRSTCVSTWAGAMPSPRCGPATSPMTT